MPTTPAFLALLLVANPEVAPPPRPAQVRLDRYGDPLPNGAVARLGSVRLRHAGLATYALPSWRAGVWAAGRTVLAGEGFHWVEVKEQGGTVFVFGAESHGAYLEAFDAKSGAAEYRFCTCYWFRHSEAWTWE